MLRINKDTHVWLSWRQWKVCLRLLALTACGLIATGLAPAAVGNNDEVALEYQVKAAMLYKFLGYIDWPPSTFPYEDSPYVIAVIGADAIADELREITEDRTVNNRPIRVREIERPQALDSVHMLFVGRSENYRLRPILEATQDYPIVTVTESEAGLEEGSIINLRLVDGRIGFDVSLVATEREQLRFSARMLAVASSVKKGGT